jgi:hypothetical protein
MIYNHFVLRKELLFMELIKKNLGTWIKAAIILTIGILFIIMGATKSAEAASDANTAINVVIGIVLLVVGALALVLAIVAAALAKKGFLAVAVPGALAIALGISILVEKYASGLAVLVLVIVPYLLIAIGALILADAIFRLVLSAKAKTVKETLFAIIIAMIVGAAILVAGILSVRGLVIPFNAQLIIFGIVLVIVALLQILFTFVKGPEAVVTIVGVKSASKEDK